jgi:putative ATP-dependent endonuclease of OLD family
MHLSKVTISNFRGIDNLTIEFDEKVNIIIGENGSHKSALIDAIRILYNFSNSKKDIYVENKDFFIDPSTQTVKGNIELAFQFRGLDTAQKGAFYEFLVIESDPKLTYAQVVLRYEYREGKWPVMDYYTGAVEGQKADYKNFELFQHYYLDALRDSTRDLLNSKNNILGKLVMRTVTKENSRDAFEKIIDTANKELLKQNAVKQAKIDVNSNLEAIFKTGVLSKIGLRLDDPKAEPFINSIKPFLPFDKVNLEGKGLELPQNSLGHNNLIYTATILGDASSRIDEDKKSHYALLIEEPEAHLHPQLQLNLFNFIKENIKDNTQIFITSHSPTLTSKAHLNNLIVLDKLAYKLDNCYTDRVGENIIEDTVLGKPIKEKDFFERKKQLERYLDVTKSQMLYAHSILFAEGISEELLIPTLFKLRSKDLQDYRIEFVNVGGTSFYPFLHLFNSSNVAKRIDKKIAILTDGDQYTDSKDSKYSFDNLILDNYKMLNELDMQIQASPANSRIANLESTRNANAKIGIYSSFKTFEYELAKANVLTRKSELESNFFVKYIKDSLPTKFDEIKNYYSTLGDNLTPEEQRKVSLLFWKTIRGKASFAQDFSIYILDNLAVAKTGLKTPSYIESAFDELTK